MRLFLLTAVLATIAAAPVHAQSAAPAPPIPSDVVLALGSSSSDVRADALHEVATRAFSYEGADLRPAVPALLTVFRTDADVRLRLMALRALAASADEGAMAALRAEAGEEPLRATRPDVRRLLYTVLVRHYGGDELRSDLAVAALYPAPLVAARQ